jgi:hypothetical protein
MSVRNEKEVQEVIGHSTTDDGSLGAASAGSTAAERGVTPPRNSSAACATSAGVTPSRQA